MTIRTARGGGHAVVRWTYGVFLTLCVALVVLVHHETCAMGTSSSMSGTVHSGHAMPVSAKAAQGMGVDEATSVRDGSSRDVEDADCSMPGMEHCASASVDTVQLAVPDRSSFDPLVPLRQAAAARTPGTLIGRAPPDLSVLSRLRQ
ncbi:hypothetical protein ABTY96_30775 [Streptomyces sp. NPDC096057]|uniref:hypothetical protein n=1 Tax=Streptomyces sp. NPDC096057 TaxID=3155543 RepID=UPI00332308F3